MEYLSVVLKLALFCAFILSSAWCWSVGHRLVQASNSTKYLLESDGTYKILPDDHTAELLFRSLHANEVGETSIPIVSDSELGRYQRSELKNPTLKMYAVNPDEVLRVACQSIEYVEPPTYWKTTTFLGSLMNPTLVNWQNKTLLIYRHSYSYKRIFFAWMKDDMSGIDKSMNYLGIGDGFCLPAMGNEEDPRALVLSDGTLFVVYGQTFADHSRMMYVRGTVVGGVAQFSEPTALVHDKYAHGFQKNWVPFEYNRTMYYLSYLNPPDVVTAAVPLLSPATSTSTGAATSINSDVQIVRTVYGIDRKAPRDHIANRTSLPWRGGLYGRHLRGGTPAILVRGELLTLFHTHVAVQHDNPWRETYFMGVMTLCPRPPFNILRTSKVPLMDYVEFYTQPWLFNNIDYVVYPAGLVLSPDEQFLWVTLGHQDKNGFVIKLEVDGLLRSLFHHNDCDDNMNQAEDILREGGW